MPGIGEQHNHSAANPFEEAKPHLSEYTAAEIATLSSRLEKQLGPEYISSRAGPGGGKVHYLSADKCINLANEVFGFNGWSSSIQNIQIDFVDETDQGRVSLGLSVTLRVTLREGTYHEDVGYGHIENCKGKAAAFEKAKKEGTTDALKRALRNFGNLLGNCVYDKEYVAKVTKLKVGPTKWDPENLHRHRDFAPVKQEPSREQLRQQPSLPRVKQEALAETDDTQGTIGVGGEDEFGSDDFDAVDFAVPNGGHPDEVMLDAGISSEHSTSRPNLTNRESLMKIRNAEPRNILAIPSPSSRPTGPHTPNAEQRPLNRQPPLFQQNPDAPAPAPPQLLPVDQDATTIMTSDLPYLESSNPIEHEPPVGFFTARAAESLQAGPNPAIKAPLFNPHLESPSIRKTAGVDHTKSKPVNRDLTEVAPVPSPATVGVLPRGNIINPQTDRARKVGMPVGAGSPMQNRGSYKPPQVKRPIEVGALRDVTAASINASDSVEAKRQRGMGSGGSQDNNGLLKV